MKMSSNMKAFWIGILTLTFLWGVLSTDKYWQVPEVELGPPSAHAADAINARICDPNFPNVCVNLAYMASSTSYGIPIAPACVYSLHPTLSIGTNSCLFINQNGSLDVTLGTALSGSINTSTTPNPDSIQTWASPTTTYSGGATSLTSVTLLFPADPLGYSTTVENQSTAPLFVCPFSGCTTANAPFLLTQFQMIPKSWQDSWKGVWYALTAGVPGTAGGARQK